VNLSASDRNHAVNDQFIRYRTLSQLPEKAEIKAVRVDSDGTEKTAHDANWRELGMTSTGGTSKEVHQK
jgi:hypothetical protein